MKNTNGENLNARQLSELENLRGKCCRHQDSRVKQVSFLSRENSGRLIRFSDI